MKKLVLILASFIISQNSFSAETKTFFRAEYGLGKFETEKLDSLNANPSGSVYGFGVGAKMAYIEVGAFFKQSTLESDITHDNAANKIIHNGKTFGIDMNIFLNNHLGLKLGYAFSKYTQSIATPVDAVTTQAIKTAYGLEDNNSSNFYYGANVDIFANRRWDVSVSVAHYPMENGKSSTAAALGIRLYIDASFADFFGTR